MSGSAGTESTKPAPKWRPISARDRRVLGVLVEKAKTTPDQYPMTLNGICTGANQKSNRFPQMELQPEDVEESLDRLRAMGAVAEVQGSGRVDKYRHFMYEWLGVDKLELAVMAELLLRGAQTEGELRGRASRMDTIPDLTTLRGILDSLKAKGLVVSLTHEGRGHVITHALYEPRELEKLRAEYGASGSAPSMTPLAAVPLASTSGTVAGPSAASASELVEEAANPSPPAGRHIESDLHAMQRELASLRDEVAELRSEVQDLSSTVDATADELRRLKEAFGA